MIYSVNLVLIEWHSNVTTKSSILVIVCHFVIYQDGLTLNFLVQETKHDFIVMKL